jgi:hypothetical protein
VTTTTSAGGVTTTTSQGQSTVLSNALARTGYGFGILVLLAALAFGAGVVLVPWHRRQIVQTEAGWATGPAATGRPDTWGLDDIGRALIGAIMVLASRLFKRPHS